MSDEMVPSAPETKGQTILEARDVAVHFGGVHAVDGVSFSLRPGLIYGIIGPNGSGKSTLLGALSRLTRLTRGSLMVDGEHYEAARPSEVAHLGISRTFQIVRLADRLSTEQNIQLGLDMAVPESVRGSMARFGLRARVGFRGEVRSPGVDQLIARFGLGGVRKLRPGELSYGDQRRVEIARALASSPRLLLLDEPTAGMARSERDAISSLLRSLRDSGLSQLLVEHDVQMMVDTCDYLFAMNAGQLIAKGKPDQVVRNAKVQEAYLGRRRMRDA